jgi:ACR3 family arsenite efflux pump ArsB
LGIYLVLLTPCIDYVVVFTGLGQGDSALILAATPLLLLLQLLLLPLYLLLFLGNHFVHIINAKPFLSAFFGLIIGPLIIAFATEFYAKRNKILQEWLSVMGWFPVPTLGLTLLLVVASQVNRIEHLLSQLFFVIPIYVSYLIIAPLLGMMVAKYFNLSIKERRSIAFSAGTRNSLVVLPLALALPPTLTIVPAIIVMQTLIELLGELMYIRLIPNLIK